jgi:hypothetical protein
VTDASNHIFTKSDYLTPLQVSKILETDEQTAYRALKTMYLRRATVMVKTGYNKSPRPMVICSRYSRSEKSGILPYRLRSDALEEIAKYIQEQKNKGK